MKARTEIVADFEDQFDPGDVDLVEDPGFVAPLRQHPAVFDPAGQLAPVEFLQALQQVFERDHAEGIPCLGSTDLHAPMGTDVQQDRDLAASRARDDHRILGDGAQSKSYIHVQDIIRAVLLAHDKQEKPFEVYNVATGDYITILAISMG